MQCFQRCVHVQGTLSSHPQPHPPTMISVATQNKWRSIKDVYMCKKLYHPIPNLAPPHPPHFGHRRTTTIVGIYIYIFFLDLFLRLKICFHVLHSPQKAVQLKSLSRSTKNFQACHRKVQALSFRRYRELLITSLPNPQTKLSKTGGTNIPYMWDMHS